MKKNKTEIGRWYIKGDAMTSSGYVSVPEYAKTTEDVILEKLEKIEKQLEKINKKLNG